MKIVVCDDNVAFEKEFVLMLNRAFLHKGYTIEVKSYQSPQELIYAGDEDVDAYFLDIEMPGMDGIELADFLKQKKDSEFIFVSIHDDLLRKTMKVKPIAFVRKDFIQSDLDEAVENFLKEYAQKKKTIAFQDGKRLVTFPLRNIIYFYSEKDYVVVCLDNEDLEQSIRQKLDSIDKKMKPYEFLRIHNRYLINLRRIKKLHNFRGKKDNAIEMDNGRILPVSQKYVDLVRESIYEWFHQGNT